MKKILLSLLLVFTICFSLSGVAFAVETPGDPPVQTPADSPTKAAKDAVCSGLTQEVGADPDCTGGNTGIANIMKIVLEIISFIAGFAAVIMIMVGGIKYSTSGGDTSKISSAKSTLLYALVGVVVVTVAQFLVRYVINQAS